MDSYIAKALIELRTKSLNAIQIETALTWCGRACAAAQMGNLMDAREYAHEAVEHAALSGNDELFRAIRDKLDAHGVVIG